MHGKVISVAHADRKADAKVIIEDKKDNADHQLWYEGKLGHIRSKMNDYVLESKSEWWIADDSIVSGDFNAAFSAMCRCQLIAERLRMSWTLAENLYFINYMYTCTISLILRKDMNAL